MERQVSHLVDGELREETQYYHRICVVAIVSSAFPIPLGIRFQKNGETEVACSLALLKDLIEKVGSRFLDLLVFDALYLQTPFTREVEALGLDWVGNLKENQPELLAEAQRVTAGAPEVHSQGSGGVAALARSGGLLARGRPHASGWSKRYATGKRIAGGFVGTREGGSTS